MGGIDIFIRCQPIVVKRTTDPIRIEIVTCGNNEFRLEFFGNQSHLPGNFFLIVLTISSPVTENDEFEWFFYNLILIIIIRPGIFLGGCKKYQKSQTHYQCSRTHIRSFEGPDEQTKKNGWL